MPELPDVEIARRRLEKALGGGTIVAAHSADRYVLRPRAPKTFGPALVDRTIREIGRRGKWLRLVLDDGTRLFSHLGMTGWWQTRSDDDPGDRSERARIDVLRSDGQKISLRYLDSRRFGRLVVNRQDIPEWTDLGPDLLSDGIDARMLASALSRTRRPLKDALMNQRIIAGIGNILATEALWHARIDPRSRSDALSRAEVAAVLRGLHTAVNRELAVRERARGDEWVDVFSIYGRAGERCPRCGSTIARVVMGGRTTAFCKHCQKRIRKPARS
ncbi:MAG TPA: DNA-formamidopyrimidine glycosylase family protein [Polyangia bacterium]|jgi:formamidopyrimidine-DNA glycosylase|nr:DNA-formamidopyrimidine glycosylase family protein [Polyangia bacterium]